jgi:hypothetical protein
MELTIEKLLWLGEPLVGVVAGEPVGEPLVGVCGIFKESDLRKGQHGLSST